MTSQHVKREPSEDSGHISPVDSEQDSDDISSVSSRGTDQFTRPKPKVRRTNSNNAAGAAMRARKYNSDPAVMSKRYRWHNQLQTLTSALSSRSTRVRNRLDSNVTYDEVVHIAAAEIEKLRLEVAALEAKLSAKQALQSLRQHRIPSRPSASPSPAVSPASASSSGITGMSVDSSASPIPSEEDIKPGSVSFWDTLVLSEAACALVSPSLRVLQCTESFARSRFQPMSKAALLQSNMSILDFFPPSQTPEVLLMISSLWTFGSVSVDNFVIRNSTSVRLIDFTCFANKDPSKENRVNSIVFIIRKQHLAPPQASSSTPLMVPATTTSAFLRQQPQSTSSTVSASSSPAIYQNTSAATPSSTTPAYSSLALSSNLSDKSSNCASVPSIASTPATSVASAPLSLPLPAYKPPQSVPSLIDLVNSLSQSSQPKLTQFSASITSAVPQPVVAGSSLGPMMYPPFLSTSVSAYAAAAAAVTGSDTMSLYQQMKNANDSLRGRVLC